MSLCDQICNRSQACALAHSTNLELRDLGLVCVFRFASRDRFGEFSGELFKLLACLIFLLASCSPIRRTWLTRDGNLAGKSTLRSFESGREPLSVALDDG